jgi:hypothetical protein
MSTPSSPDILEWEGSQAQFWAERGDLKDAGEEEGQEGRQEEEVRGCPGKGGWNQFTLPLFFRISQEARMPKAKKKAAPKKKTAKKK